jgi:PAS domain S-box-containing protein
VIQPVPGPAERTDADTFRALHEIAVASGGVLEPEALADLVVERARELMGVGGSVLRWWEPDTGVIRLMASREQHHVPTELAPDQGIAGQVFKTRRPVRVNDYANWPHATPWALRDGAHAALFVPLLVRHEPVGVLGVVSYVPHTFNEDDELVLSLLAAQVAPALEAARLHARIRAAEAVNRENAELLRQVLDSISSLITVRDADGNYLVVNRAMAEMFGSTIENMQGRNIGELWTPDDVRTMRREDRRVLRSWKPMYNPDASFRTLDGRAIHVCYWRIPFKTASGVPAVLIVSQDIADRKRAEEARAESEAKSRFLATMSHELRTPLNSVLGFAQLLAQETFGDLNDRQERYVDHILSGGRHLLELINDVLDLSKVQSGRMELKPVQLSVAQVLREAAAKAQPLAGERGVSLRVQAARGLHVKADRRRLDQVLWNLLSNAIRFTPEGGAVTLRSHLEGGQVVIDVIDTGVGIAPEMHDRIFEEFTQVDSGSRRSQDGTGLGLALTRSLLKLMGGTITVESELGKGSTFSAKLPSA